MRSLVTGGCGFIGSHIVDELINLGHDVIVIDDLSAESNNEFYYNDKALSYHISINDLELIRPLFKGVDNVFHLAAESRIQPTLERPMDACLTNFVGTCNVLQLSKEYGVKRFLYSSTSAGYGLVNPIPSVENFKRDCLNPYSVTKVAAEDLVRMYYTLWELPTVIFRYFNVYGERSPTKGQYAPVLGLFLKQKEEGQSLKIVGDGKQRRDFVHVKDVVQANIKAMQYEGNSSIFGEIFNVGSGKNHSILELAQLISRNFEFLAPREGEARDTLANISKIQEHLGYSPTINIEEWIKKQV